MTYVYEAYFNSYSVAFDWRGGETDHRVLEKETEQGIARCMNGGIDVVVVYITDIMYVLFTDI